MSTEALRDIAEGRRKTNLSEESLAAIRLLIAERKGGGNAGEALLKSRATEARETNLPPTTSPPIIPRDASQAYMPAGNSVKLTFYWADSKSALGQMLTKGGCRNMWLDGSPGITLKRGGDPLKLSSTVGKHRLDFQLSDGLVSKSQCERFEINCAIPGDYLLAVTGKFRGTELRVTDPRGDTEVLKSKTVATPRRGAGVLQQLGAALIVLSWVFYQSAKPFDFEFVSRRTIFALCGAVAGIGFGFLLVGRKKE